jgi:hypothetical protein
MSLVWLCLAIADLERAANFVGNFETPH